MDFRKITLEDVETLKKFRVSGDMSCENTFTSLLIWRDIYNNSIAIEDDTLFISSDFGEGVVYSIPFTKNMEKAIDALKKHNNGVPVTIWAQEGARFDEFYKKFGSDYDFISDEDYFDYIYLQKDLAELNGKKYHSKRNHISAFSKAHNWHYETINDTNIQLVRECAEKWYNENLERDQKHFSIEKQGVYLLLDNFEKTDLKGGAIFCDGMVVAFTLGSEISDTVFNIHIEKALSDYSTAYAVINREFAKNELSDYVYINREDDMGLEGLCKAKLSYKPERLIKKYYCIPKENNDVGKE